MSFTNFLILNIIISVIDTIMPFPIFIRNDTLSLGSSKSYTTVNNICWMFALLLPTGNLKHALSNIFMITNNTNIIIVM